MELSGYISYENDHEDGDFFVDAWYNLRGVEFKFDLTIYPKNTYRFAVSLGVVGFNIMYFV